MATQTIQCLLLIFVLSAVVNSGKLGSYNCKLRGGRNGQCTTNSEGPRSNAPCVFPFSYKNAAYYGCTEVERNKPWCATAVDDLGNVKEGEWGYCPEQCTKCLPKVCTSGTGDHHRCKFGFRHEGYKHYGCITAGKGYLWCATHLTDDNGHYDETRNCTGYCDRETCLTTSGPDNGSPCIFPFNFKGQTYNSCTMVNHTVPWCATKVYGNKEMEKWGHCGLNCNFG